VWLTAHATNFTAGHETRARVIGDDRLAYPPGHIEVDNRLSWFLGGLESRFGDEAYYVHLTRDPDEVARSYNKRWYMRSTIVRGFREAIMMNARGDPLEVCRYYVRVVQENIEAFLSTKSHVLTMDIADIERDFPKFWTWIGAEGDVAKALATISRKHNATASERRRRIRSSVEPNLSPPRDR
jgi:hypothetical protein